MTRTSEKNKKEGKVKHLVLLDAHAIIHRAYHALPDFSNSKGDPTGALYGLSSMLIKIITDLKPDYIAACLDLPEKTHRHDVYDGYKGTRVKTDDALAQQLSRAPEIFAAFNIPVYAKAGFEADDCLGTIVSQLRGEGHVRITIASGDMDTLQLVEGDRVQVFTLRKGINDTITYNEDAVVTRFGFTPAHIPDYKGLMGDPSDNIKGVRGIGEKTAQQLVKEFGTIEKMYATLKKSDENFLDKGFTKRVVQLLKDGEDDALFSKMLATIRTDAPITFGFPARVWHDTVDTEKLLTSFDEFEFRSLKNRAQTLWDGKQPETPTKQPLKTIPTDTLEAKEACVMLWLLHSDMTNPTVDDVLRYTKTHALTEAYVKLQKEIERTGRLKAVFEDIEHPLIPVVDAMKARGVKIDLSHLTELSKKHHHTLEALTKEIHTLAGHEFNINSPAQLGEVLFSELDLGFSRQKKTATGKLSTKEDALLKLHDAHPIIPLVLRYREVAKLLSTYIDAIPKLVASDGRLHPDMLQAGTTTGRMASQNPNIQNIPVRTEEGRDIRAAFVAEEGFILAAFDYSQIELRIAAGLSGEKELIRAFGAGEDVHTAVAAKVFGVPIQKVDSEMRRRAKVINFGIMYGMGALSLKQNLGEGVSRDEASAFLASYFSTFPRLAAFLEKTKKDAEKNGFTETLFGRRRQFSGFRSPLPYVRAQAERMALNAPIQGTQSDIIKKAMVNIAAWIVGEKIQEDVRLILQVHDELVFEVRAGILDRAAEHIRERMEHVIGKEELSSIPLTVEMRTGKNWGTLT